MSNLTTKIIAGALTLTILSLMLIAGPSQAFILGLTVLNTNIEWGEEISFSATAQIEPGEYMDINRFILNLTGHTDLSCSFYPNATKINGCSNFNIQQISTTNYGYGYGYQEGNLTYNITLQTNNMISGNYSSTLYSVTDTEIYSYPGQEITLNPNPESPVINLVSYPESTYSTNIEFRYNVSDTDTENCSLIINNIEVETHNITNQTVDSFFRTLSPSSYEWKISCTDNLSNIAMTSPKKLTILSPPPVITGSGGGGGGWSPKKNTNTTQTFNFHEQEEQKCEPNWRCSWSSCTKEKEKYYLFPENCIDINNCGNNIGKPDKIECSEEQYIYSQSDSENTENKIYTSPISGRVISDSEQKAGSSYLILFGLILPIIGIIGEILFIYMKKLT
jgi:hypothetical protein